MLLAAWTYESGGAQGARPPPHFSKSRAMCSFSCNLFALVEDFEDAKITSRIHVSSDF